MIRNYKILALFLFFTVLFPVLVRMTSNTQIASSTLSDMQWHQTFGGTDTEIAYSVIQTTDGGFALSGSLLIKTDANGIIQWHQTYEGDDIMTVIQTSDGSFIIAVGSLLVKTDANGNVQWSHTYKGREDVDIRSVIQTTDGGFALTGWTKPYGVGCRDIWLVRTDANGILQWNQTYVGGSEDLQASCTVVQTADGGFALTGEARPYGSDWSDMWLIKTDNNGIVQWNHTYGGAVPDAAWSIIQTTDGGFALAGETYSYSSSTSERDMWLVKTDMNGIMQWNRTYGGKCHEIAHSVIQTVDGGFALAGYTCSYGAGGFDMWLVKTDVNGIMQGHQTYGGVENEEANSVIQTTKGDFVLAGYTQSFGAGELDMWLVRTYTPTTLATATADSKTGLIELPFIVFFLISITIIGYYRLTRRRNKKVCRTK